MWAMHVTLFFFFFQAEDGIRDYKVTGVQTCALPISRRLLDELRVRAGREHVRAVSLAGIYSALGQTDEAFVWLERGYEERDVAFPFFRGNLPATAFMGVATRNLMSDPRYQALLRKIGLE